MVEASWYGALEIAKSLSSLLKKTYLDASPVRLASIFTVLVLLFWMSALIISYANRDPPWANGLRYVSSLLLFFAFLVLIICLVHKRVTTPVSISVRTVDDNLQASPCTSENVWFLDQPTIDRGVHEALKTLSSPDRRKIHVVCIRQATIPKSLLELWRYLPHLTVLDVQHSRLPEGFWDSLEECKELSDVLAHGTVVPIDLKEVSMTIPETRVHIAARRLIVYN
ncbi:MAG: hypothetical protein KGQ60_03655 [Planctomycetes bacterium]|nr:hypothetical protein [Planctomycetota bacterium]